MPNGRGMSCLEELNICFKGENLLGLYGRNEKRRCFGKHLLAMDGWPVYLGCLPM